MSSLAFDTQGKPFAWHKRTAKLSVRLFLNLSAHGTCCQVLDGGGSPLFVDTIGYVGAPEVGALNQLHFELWERDLDRHFVPVDPSARAEAA